MNELKKMVVDARKSIGRLMFYFENNKEVDIPIEYDLEQMHELFVWLGGFVDCLERNGLLPQEKE